MSDLTVFHFDAGRESFEDFGHQNGGRHWAEADLMAMLDYQTKTAFRKAITRAMQACLSLGILTEDNFALKDGEYQLNRFACYLVAMNGDSKKPQVAAAQLYFAALAETFQHHLEHADGIDRVLIRSEMTDGLKSLFGTAKRHGVENYAFFQNAGYRGMYNMDLARLTAFKGAKVGEKLLDRMGKNELAANLFRITQTDAKIKNENLQGQANLESAAHKVGKTVRETMIHLSGTAPENLQLSEPVQDVKKKLKSTSKKFKQLDYRPKDNKG